MNPFSLTDIMRVSMIRAIMLQDSGIATGIGIQPISKLNVGGNFTQTLVDAVVPDSVQESGGNFRGKGRGGSGGGVDGIAEGIGGEAGAAGGGTGTGGGAGTGGQGAGGASGCFPIGTMIGILGGEVPIENIIGGMCLEDSGAVLSRVDHAPRDWDLLILSFDGGELRITPEHKIFCQRVLGFIPAEMLEEGDKLRMKDCWTTVLKITRTVYNGPIYNLLTSNSTFLANRVLVHNMKHA